MVNVNIYRVDAIIDLYAKTPSDYTSLQRRYRALTKGKRFNNAFPRYTQRMIGLEKGSGGGSYAHFYGHYGSRKSRDWMISLGSNRSEPVLLHEIAHMVARLHPEYGYCSDHGPGFASALLDVVRVALGAEAERSLKHAYKALGIKVYSPGKRNGVKVRVRGDAPEKAAGKIADIVGFKKAAANERAMARKAVEAAGFPSGRDSKVECPICGEECEVFFQHYMRGGRGKWFASCDACSLHEMVVADAPMRIAAH